MKLTLLTSLLAATILAATCNAATTEFVPADDSRFNFAGRIDFSDAESPEIVWQGSRVELAFEGDSLEIAFADVQGQVYFDLNIDGDDKVIKAENGTVKAPFDLIDEKHYFTLTKRSEASAGTCHFNGVTVSNPSKYITDTPTKKYIFYGDSITAGACNEDGELDQWNDRSTHNNSWSYGAFTAKAMHAQYRNVAVSGMGVSVGYTQYTFPEIWNRYGPSPDYAIAPVSYYKPDVVFINLGENDDSFSKNNGDGSFPNDYASRYIVMVRDMRKAYPESKIVILRGGMYGGSQSERLRSPWEEVVNILESEDSNISHFVFKHWTNTHPRVADHQKMSEELVAWLKSSHL